MKLLWRIAREAIEYKAYYIYAILSTFALTAINLIAPKLLSEMINTVTAKLTYNDLQRFDPQEIDGSGMLANISAITITLTVIYLARIIFRFCSNYYAHKAAWHLVENVRIKVYDKIQSLSMSFFHDKQTGDLMSRVVNDTAMFEMLYAHIIPDIITNLITFIGVMAILLTINVRLAFLTCIPIPFILISGWIFSKKVRPNFKAAQKSVADLNAKIQDNFSGIHEIQAFNKEEYETGEVREKANEYTKSILYALKNSAIFHPTVEFLSAVGTIIVVAFGGYLAYYNKLNAADIVAFLLYLSLFYAPITNIAKLLEDTQQAYAGAERVMAVLDQEQDVKNAEGAAALCGVSGEIEFRNVDFRYKEESPVLKNISFKCEAGRTVALVGPTGVGKTTLTQLIARFYDVTAGQVLIDGKDIRSITLESLRRNIAPVLQDTFLFNGTIAENIAYSIKDADIETIKEAAKAAKIHESIMEMPDGYNTKVGERGLRLSGGQKQRVAIARAILRGSPIIILDEATASVDTETEKEIQSAINELSKTKTIVAIAHRLSTIKNADLIIVLKDGEIAEQGTHEELLKHNGLYSKLYGAQ